MSFMIYYLCIMIEYIIRIINVCAHFTAAAPLAKILSLLILIYIYREFCFYLFLYFYYTLLLYLYAPNVLEPQINSHECTFTT